MADSPRQLRKKGNSTKPSTNRYVSLALIAIIVGVGVYFAAGRSGEEKKGTASLTPINKSLSTLYNEADRDFKKKKWGASGHKFRQIANIKSDYRDADEKAKEIAQTLFKQGQEYLSNGEEDKAKAAFAAAKAADPENDDIQIADDSFGDGGGKDDGGTGDGTGKDDGGSDSGLKKIPDGATPKSILLREMNGWLTIKRDWNNEPVEASAVYLPRTEVRRELDRVIFTAFKLDTKKQAKERLQAEKDAHPMESEDIQINGHEAYLGLYNFEGASEYFQLRQIAALTWVRDDGWLFVIQILPKATPANDYKKGIAKDIAIRFGY